MERGYVVNMVERNKCIKQWGPPCGMMDGSKKWPTMQYGWSEWIVNIVIHTKGYSQDGTQIVVNSRKWPGKS